MAQIKSFLGCYKMSTHSLEVTTKVHEPRPSCEVSGWHLTSSQKHKDKEELLAALTKFTHILSVFIHKIRDCPEGDRDRKDLLDLATHYTHNVLRPSQEELRQDHDLRGQVEVFQQQLDDLKANLRMLRGDSAEAHQEDTISACTAIELLIRCLWPRGESFTDAGKLAFGLEIE